MKFEVFKSEKTTLKNLSEGKYRQPEKEEFEAFERVIILLLYTFFEIRFSTDELHYCLTGFSQKTYLMTSLMLILGISS